MLRGDAYLAAMSLRFLLHRCAANLRMKEAMQLDVTIRQLPSLVNDRVTTYRRSEKAVHPAGPRAAELKGWPPS